MKNISIAVIGECMIELQKVDGRLNQSFGGDTLNTALYLSRLTKSVDITTSYVTALGQDSFSKEMLNTWQEEGIDTSLTVSFENKQPGIYHIETDTTGERSFYYWRNESAAKYLFEHSETERVTDKLFSYNAIYLSGITLAILTDEGRTHLFRFLEAYKKQGGRVYFDNNYRPKLWNNRAKAMECYQTILGLTDTALLTFDDEQMLYGDKDLEACITRTSRAGVGEIVIKRGGKACLVVAGGTASYITPEDVDNIVDTTAAGDSFSAGYLARRLTGGDPNESAQFGHKMAGHVIQHKGAIIPLAVMPELELAPIGV